MPGEQIVLSLNEVVESKKPSHRTLGIIIIIIGVILILVYYIGIILIILGIYLCIKGKGGSIVYSTPTGRKYVLTNKRAIVQGKDGIIRQVSLFDSVPMLRNVRVVSESVVNKAQDGSWSKTTAQVERGDIAFMENNKVEMEFNNVENPRDLVNKIENIVKNTGW